MIIGRIFHICFQGTQEEAAAAYDMAAIEYRGPNAVTNFDISIYADKLKKVQEQMQIGKSKSSSTTDAQEDNLQEEKQVLDPKDSDITIPIVVMDPSEEHEHPWTLCLDTGFNSLPVSEIPFEKPAELPDLFVDSGFEDNIDFIFDAAPFVEIESSRELKNQDALSGNSTLCGVEVDSLASSISISRNI